MSRIARSHKNLLFLRFFVTACGFYKICENSEKISSSPIFGSVLRNFQISHSFVMLINSQPQSQLADFKQIVKIAKDR